MSGRGCAPCLHPKAKVQSWSVCGLYLGVGCLRVLPLVALSEEGPPIMDMRSPDGHLQTCGTCRIRPNSQKPMPDCEFAATGDWGGTENLPTAAQIVLSSRWAPAPQARTARVAPGGPCALADLRSGALIAEQRASGRPLLPMSPSPLRVLSILVR